MENFSHDIRPKSHEKSSDNLTSDFFHENYFQRKKRKRLETQVELNNHHMHGTRTVHDIIDYAIKNDIPSLAMLVDFKKAFDSVSHSFIKNAMRKFKFNEKFIHWINTLLSGFKSRTLVNGCLGDIIDLKRG